MNNHDGDNPGNLLPAPFCDGDECDSDEHNTWSMTVSMAPWNALTSLLLNAHCFSLLTAQSVWLLSKLVKGMRT